MIDPIRAVEMLAKGCRDDGYLGVAEDLDRVVAELREAERTADQEDA